MSWHINNDVFTDDIGMNWYVQYEGKTFYSNLPTEGKNTVPM